MRKAFTLIELMICIAIVAIICAIAIPNIMESPTRAKYKNNEVTIDFKDLVGKTFEWNGNTTIVVNYNYPEYSVVLRNSNGGMVAVKVERKVIMEAYMASSKQVEKPQ